MRHFMRISVYKAHRYIDYKKSSTNAAFNDVDVDSEFLLKEKHEHTDKHKVL